MLNSGEFMRIPSQSGLLLRNSTIGRGLILVLGLFALIGSSAAQQRDLALERIVSGVKPGVAVVVRQQPSGAEIVDVTMLDATYPANLLRQQCDQLARLAGVPMLGAQFWDSAPGDDRFSFQKARFGTDNLIDRETGQLWLDPILKAFAGIPAPHTIESLLITFEGFTANQQTIRTYLDDHVAVLGTAVLAPAPAVEYRVRLLTQDQSKITVPKVHTPENVKKPNPEQARRTNSVLPAVLYLAIGLLGAGCLVYFGFLAVGKPSAKRPREGSK